MRTNPEHIAQYTCNRRDFITKIALGSIALSLPAAALSCASDPEFEGAGKVPYKVWEELLHYLKTSPDHLQGQMEVLILEADPEKMFDFVKNQLLLIPTEISKIGKSNALKWGWKYALRSGMATVQEKAELLTYMYQKAGFNARIVHEHTKIKPEETIKFFLRDINRPFEPKISEKQMNRWADELGYSGYTEFNGKGVDNDSNLAHQLGEKIWNDLNLPSNYNYRTFDFRWDNTSTPTVELKHEGKIFYAHLCDPDVPFGSLRDKNNTITAAKKPIENLDKVQIVLTYRDSITPENEQVLIDHEWLAKDLVGRQLNIMFLDNLIPEVRRVTPIQSIRTFTPAFALQAIGEDATYMESHSKLVDPITLGGRRITLPKGNLSAKINGVAIKAKTDKNLQSRIKYLDAVAKPVGYPKVKLSVSPRDEQGEIVEGLSAKDFLITDGGQPVSALLESNQKIPRILILSDASMSMPAEYRGDQMDAFVTNLQDRIKVNYPDAIITHWITPSSLYTWLLKASNTDADLVIFATDGHNDDNYHPNNEASYKNGPPAIILNVIATENKSVVNTFNHMATITDGMHILANDPKKTIEAIISYLEKIEIHPYTFSYFSTAKTEQRHVTIAIDNNRLNASCNYQFSNMAQLGPRIIGVYLKLKYANQPTVKRVLAGWENDIHRKGDITDALAKEVNDFMLGSTQLYFEGNGPTYAAAVTDLLNYKLSTRDWGELFIDNKPIEAREVYEKGQLSISGSVLNLIGPLYDIASQKSLTYANGLKIGMQTLKPGFITSKAMSQFDYFPTSQYTTIGTSPLAAFKTTMYKTSQLAIREYELFEDSTFKQLADKSWINLSDARESKWLDSINKDDLLYWRERIYRNSKYKIFDSSASSKAFWNIDGKTGEVYGMLPNGSGGGSSELPYDTSGAEPYLEALGALMKVLGRLKALHPIGSHALAIVAIYGITLVKLYAIVSETILLMDASGMDAKIRTQLKQFACEVAVETVGFKSNKIAWGLNKIIGDIDMEAMGCNG
ncbi:hypothetical protein BXY82_2456 [Gelidibacter sediminis]|uniref:Uncharacterized protein n=1 Tax=Gelidibacter sediminis TaxID=1608710 RepID=A0A4R7Q1C1_9FLAO|nr:hypothetical protein [Gelidibacter sediminis]TDU40409.1 hypothetical protein BXY82_2456 [Gelidibacter sediminis]